MAGGEVCMLVFPYYERIMNQMFFNLDELKQANHGDSFGTIIEESQSSVTRLPSKKYLRSGYHKIRSPRHSVRLV
jgi:hypothetical protein